jgi:hypothetical protein
MSALLKEAFIDAKALRDVALKNAEATIVEKYSDEVRKTLDSLLEQEELGADLGGDLGGDPFAAGAAPTGEATALPEEEGSEPILEDEDVPLAATDGFSHLKGKNLGSTPNEGEDIEVNVDLDALQETIRQLQDGVDEDFEINEEELASMLSGEDVLEEDDDEDPQGAGEMADATGSAGEGEASAAETAAAAEQDKKSGYGGEDQVEALEEFEIPEELVDRIMEKMTVDMHAEKSGWAGRSPDSIQWEIEKELARRSTSEMEKELKVLKKAQEELIFENKKLRVQIKKYKQATTNLKENMHDVNISNARLLYTNRVLRNTSLNERQKTKIAEAISNAGSVMEAKTIYDTLQSAVPSHPISGQKSLSETISRPSSIIRASRKETQTTDPFLDRMKKLAGIN